MSDLTDNLLTVEKERCQFMMVADYDGLASIFSDDLVYIHTNGHCDNKDEILARLQSNFDFIEVTRGPLNIIDCGDSAVMTGKMFQRVIPKKGERKEKFLESMITQVWKKDKAENKWVMVAFQGVVLN